MKESLNPTLQNADDNRSKNKDHYDTVFRGTGIEAMLDKVRRLDDFMNDATRTDTSWVALYRNGFRERLRGARVLELGSGDGLNSLVMAAAGAEVVSIDISSVAAELLTTAAARLGFSDRVVALSGDFATMPLPRSSFDFVVGKAFLHHLTHELEERYLLKAAALLTPVGEARFAEPAVNSAWLDNLRWLMPVPGRPSRLNRRAFAAYLANDPHPERDNSSTHYQAQGARYFTDVEVVPIGALERFHRLLPEGSMNRRFRRAAFRAEHLMPGSLRRALARAQLVRYARPFTVAESDHLYVTEPVTGSLPTMIRAQGPDAGMERG